MFLICYFEKKKKWKYDPWKIKKKKQKNAKKTSLSSTATWIAFLAWKKLKFGFLYFNKSCRELNFLYKKLILNQLEFWKKGYGQNMK